MADNAGQTFLPNDFTKFPEALSALGKDFILIALEITKEVINTVNP